VNLSGAGSAERIWLEEATADYFVTLGMRHPHLGRYFQPGDDNGELAHPSVVISYRFWQSHFRGDSAVIGDTGRLHNHPITIIGVTPPDYHGVDPILDIDVFAPLNQTWPTLTGSLSDRATSNFNAIGVLKPGLSLASAREAVRAKARVLERDYPDAN